MEHVGIDVHKKESQVCILTEDGGVIEKRIRTQRERFSELFKERPRARILIEASTESEWVARCLEGLGHEVVVADPNFAPMYATRSRRVKTDERDFGLVPSENSSGEKQRKGRITKAGNARVRWLLVQVAVSIMRLRTPETFHLRAWAERIASRRGKKTAVVVLARRLARHPVRDDARQQAFHPTCSPTGSPGRMRL
jgi:transposase